MTPTTIAWFAASSTLIGAFVSIFRPDNGLCPINLAPRGRVALTTLLTTGQGFLQAMVGGADWQTALFTSLATLLAVLGAHGNTSADYKPAPVLQSGVFDVRKVGDE